MKIIVGLGNPGKKHEKTRHNIGFMILNKLATESFKKTNKFNAQISVFSETPEKILLVKPQTFMNNSGFTVSKTLNFYKLNPQNDLLLIYDDKDLPFGNIRLRKNGGAGGHNGIKSIINSIGTKNFSRLRFGIRNEFFKGGETTADFVLSSFSQTEKKQKPELIKKSCKILKFALEYDFVSAMNEFNKKSG
ncbi:MAG: aminoacyl-tRNA hydrolase [Alphaproteobacteria bacterium]